MRIRRYFRKFSYLAKVAVCHSLKKLEFFNLKKKCWFKASCLRFSKTQFDTKGILNDICIPFAPRNAQNLFIAFRISIIEKKPQSPTLQ